MLLLIYPVHRHDVDISRYVVSRFRHGGGILKYADGVKVVAAVEFELS